MFEAVVKVTKEAINCLPFPPILVFSLSIAPVSVGRKSAACGAGAVKTTLASNATFPIYRLQSKVHPLLLSHDSTLAQSASKS